MKITFLGAPMLAAALVFSAVATQAAETLTKGDVEKIVKETIQNNPELLAETLMKYQEQAREKAEQELAKQLKEKSAEMLKDKASPVAGNVKGDVTVVEFFDYHCGYCKKMLPTINQLIEDDKKVRVMFKELPILSPDSETAARASLAVFRIKPEKYFEYHSKLMSTSGKFNEAMLTEEAKKLGVDEAKFKKEMNSDWVKSELQKNQELAASIGVRGTPAFVIGETLIPGATDLAKLKETVANARKK